MYIIKSYHLSPGVFRLRQGLKGFKPQKFSWYGGKHSSGHIFFTLNRDDALKFKTTVEAGKIIMRISNSIMGQLKTETY